MEPIRTVDPDGVVRFYNEAGQLHREDGPAVEYCKSKAQGGFRWFSNGKKHRIDGPAIVHGDGTMEWWFNGERHREDGPAIIYASGGEKWYNFGKLHKMNGPAVVSMDNETSWYYNGRQIEASSQEEFERLINLKAFW